MARKCPDSAVLRDAFRIEVKRRARRADGTLSLGGTRFEIPARLRHLSEVHVRYARWDFSRVDLVDPRTGAVLCSIKPLDKAANANGQRRRLYPGGHAGALNRTPFSGRHEVHAPRAVSAYH